MDEQPKTQVQNGLNLICQIKSPQDQQILQSLIQDHWEGNKKILDRVGTVHFARFLFLENNTRLALFTEYDGDLNSYTMDFVRIAHDLFNALLPHVDYPSDYLPVEKHPDDFMKWVSEHDVKSVMPLYSAYPGQRVKSIIRNAADAAKAANA